MPLPSGRLSSLTLRDGFSALQSSSWVELALLPSPQRVTYEHAAPLWASEFPLILGNECSVLQSLLSVELALLPSPRGSSMSIPLPSERLSSPHSDEWVLRSPELCDRSLSIVGRASMAPLTIEGHLWAYRSLLGIWVLSLWGMSSPLLELLIGRASTAPLTNEGHLWACRSFLSVWVPSHSEGWFLRSPELAVGRASIAPSP